MNRETAEKILRVYVADDPGSDVAAEALDALLASGAVVLASDLEQITYTSRDGRQRTAYVKRDTQETP